MGLKSIRYEDQLYHFKKERSSSDTTRKVKQSFDYTCIFSGMVLTSGLAGCHIYPAGPYPELKTFHCNVIPLAMAYHTGRPNTLDIDSNGMERKPEDRIEMILENCHPDFISRVRKQIRVLKVLLEIKGVKNG